MAGIGSLANTLFGSGTADDVLVVDPNAVTTNDPKTSFVSKVNNGMLASESFLSSNRSLIREASRVASAFKDDNLTNMEKIGRLNDVFSGHGASIDKLTDPIKQSLLNALPEGTGAVASKLYIQAGKAYGTYESIADVKDVRGAMDALQRFTGDYGLGEIIDFSAEIALLTTLNEAMVDLGFPGIMDVIDEKLDRDKTGNLRKDYYVATWQTYVGASKLDQLRKIMETIEPSDLMGYYPDTLKRLLSSYTIPVGMRVSGQDEARDELLDILEKLDIHWGRYRRGDEWIWDLDTFTTLSADATTLLQTQDEYRVPVVIARSHREQDIVSHIRSLYPTYYFTEDKK